MARLTLWNAKVITVPHRSWYTGRRAVYQLLCGTVVDGWDVTFGTAMRGLGGLRPRPGPSLLYQM